MLNSTHIDLVFEDDVFKEYLCTRNIIVNELQEHIHEAIMNVLERTMSETTILEFAIMKGLHLKNSKNKRDTIQQLWNPMKRSQKRRSTCNSSSYTNSKRRLSDEECQSTTNYTCMFKWKNNSHEKEISVHNSEIVESVNSEIVESVHSEIVESVHSEIVESNTTEEISDIIDLTLEHVESTEQIEEIPNVDSIVMKCCHSCNASFEMNKCSQIHQFCAKYQKYTELRIPNSVFDNFYSVWLPVDNSISNVHYEDINKRRSMIRNVALDTSIRMDSTGYCRYLQDISLYYPSLMNATQKDALYFMNNHNVYPRTITDDMLNLLPVSNVYLI